jgi:hypothetical protein
LIELKRRGIGRDQLSPEHALNGVLWVDAHLTREGAKSAFGGFRPDRTFRLWN